MDKSREIILNDLCDISNRVREIDEGYFIVRNHKSSKWEVHHIDMPKYETLQLVSPYDELDSRLLEYIMKTSTKYAKQIMEDIEKNNARIKESKEKENKDIISDVARDVYRYQSTCSKDITDAYTTRHI